MYLKASFLTLGGLLLILVFLLAWRDYVENPKSYFSSYDEAKKSGLMDKGWIPIFIPKTSSEIHEQHSLDTNNVFISFKYDQTEKVELNEHCSGIEKIENGTRYYCNYFNGFAVLELYTDGSGKLNPHNEQIF